MRMKRFVSVLAAAVMVFGVTGCNAITIDGETENVSGEAAGNGSIGFSVSTLNNPFFVTLSEGAKEKAKTEGEKLIVVDAGDDAAKQTSDIEDLISKNISVLIVNPVDSDAVAPAVKDAVSRGIKVISVDRGVNGVDVDCAIASDNVEGAKMATEYMVSLLGENAKVAELEGVSGASATIERGKGFHLVADKKLNVVSKQTANFNRSEGMSVMENMLQANSAIQGVFAHNDEMALGAVEAVGNKKILVVGFDATDDAVAAVKAGKMAATVAQKPNLMGETAVETAIQILQGETVEKTIPVEVELITKEKKIVKIVFCLRKVKGDFLWGILHKNLQNSSEEWKCYSIYEIFIGHFIFLVLDFIHNISGERIFLFISMFSSLFSKNKSR